MTFCASKTVNGVTTNHIWDGSNIVAETDGNKQVTAKYYRGSGLISQEVSNTESYYQFNMHGDVIGLTGANGELIEDYDYDAFGNQINQSTEKSTPFRYAGEYYDEETDLIYLRNRYYSPIVGQFITEDPAKDGTNWYVYCRNNPIMHVDPWGLDSWAIIDRSTYGWENAVAQMKKYYGTEVHVVYVDTAEEFVDAWNNMGMIDGEKVEIDGVFISVHGDPTGYAVQGIDGVDFDELNQKNMDMLVSFGCNTGFVDEENNVEWAKKLEKAGCHVIYGLPGLKTHCKILSVVRREGDKIRNYIHMATGNYNDTTANLYTDMGMFTCREDIARDVAALFNMLTGYAGVPQYKKLVVAPKYMRDFFEEKIDNEIANAQAGLPCGITAKVNSLVDPGIVDLLYRASGEGVPVRLIVRGICCLLPGKKGLSENIEVHSIVGQLLEHSRIFWFENDGKPQVYIGSADWMQRNLNRRVEVVFPVVEKQLIKRIKRILALMWEDKHNTRVMQPDGSYQLYPLQEGESENNSQRQLSGMAVEAQERVIQANRRREPRQTLNDAMKK